MIYKIFYYELIDLRFFQLAAKGEPGIFFTLHQRNIQTVLNFIEIFLQDIQVYLEFQDQQVHVDQLGPLGQLENVNVIKLRINRQFSIAVYVQYKPNSSHHETTPINRLESMLCRLYIIECHFNISINFNPNSFCNDQLY